MRYCVPYSALSHNTAPQIAIARTKIYTGFYQKFTSQSIRVRVVNFLWDHSYIFLWEWTPYNIKYASTQTAEQRIRISFWNSVLVAGSWHSHGKRKERGGATTVFVRSPIWCRVAHLTQTPNMAKSADRRLFVYECAEYERECLYLAST